MFKRQILANKLRLLTTAIPGSAAVTVLVYIKVGSRYETATENGFAHFVEHLLFKGTRRRPSTWHLSQELDSLGADYNAFTAKDYTGFYVKVDSLQLEPVLEIMADMLFASTFQPAEIAKEKQVIEEEINMYQDTPMYLVDDLFEENIYHGNSLARHVLGTKLSISQASRQRLVRFYRRYYTLPNMVMSISGKFPENIAQLVSKNFKSKNSTKPTSLPSIIKVKPLEKINIKFQDTEQVHLVCGQPIKINYRHPRFYHFQLANIVFGGMMSSRLFINIREKQGLGYYISSSLNAYEDVGSWQVAAGVDKNRLRQACQLIRQEWRKLQQGIKKLELKKAQEYFNGKLTLKLEDSAQVAQWYGRSELFQQKIFSPAEIKAKVSAITLAEINKLLASNIKLPSMALTIIGPYKNKSALNLNL